MTGFLKVKPNPKLWPLAITLLVPSLVFAGGKATIMTATPMEVAEQSNTEQSDKLTLTWRDANTLRMDFGDPNHYLVMRDGKAYSVNIDEDGAQVMDMAGMSAMIQAMNPNKEATNNPLGDIQSINATKEHKTVAGIKGTVYQMTWHAPDQQGLQTERAVLTNNALVVDMTQAYFNAVGAMVGTEYTQQFKSSLPAKAAGVLQIGDDFTIESITKTKPAADLFELPAPPMDFQSLLRGLTE